MTPDGGETRSGGRYESPYCIADGCHNPNTWDYSYGWTGTLFTPPWTGVWSAHRASLTDRRGERLCRVHALLRVKWAVG